MSNWEPIETAPKDGTPLLCLTAEPQREASIYVASHKSGIWFRENGGPDRTVSARPGYWMPLPAPPKETAR